MRSCLWFDFLLVLQQKVKRAFRSPSSIPVGLHCGSYPIYSNQLQTKMESRPQVNSLSLFLQTSSPLPPPFKAEAQGNGPGDKLIFTEASPDNAATSYLPCWVWMWKKNITLECFVWIAVVMVKDVFLISLKLLRRTGRETGIKKVHATGCTLSISGKHEPK